MKKLQILLIFSFLLISCGRRIETIVIDVDKVNRNYQDSTTKVIDSLYRQLSIKQDCIDLYEVELAKRDEKIKLYIDSIKDAKANTFYYKYKLERIRKYTDIVDKKPSQMKYYKGWIKRTLNN